MVLCIKPSIKWKRQLTKWEKIFVHDISSKELKFKLYKLNIKKTIQLKMGRGPEYTSFQRRHTHGQQTHKKIRTPLIIREIQNKSQRDIISTLSERLPSKRQGTPSAGEDAEKKEPLCTVGRNLSWSSRYGNSTEVPQIIKI